MVECIYLLPLWFILYDFFRNALLFLGHKDILLFFLLKLKVWLFKKSLDHLDLVLVYGVR